MQSRCVSRDAFGILPVVGDHTDPAVAVHVVFLPICVCPRIRRPPNRWVGCGEGDTGGALYNALQTKRWCSWKIVHMVRDCADTLDQKSLRNNAERVARCGPPWGPPSPHALRTSPPSRAGLGAGGTLRDGRLRPSTRSHPGGGRQGFCVDQSSNVNRTSSPPTSNTPSRAPASSQPWA